MKYAIDVEDKEIKSKLIETLRKEGHTVIDCEQEKDINVGESHYRKVLLSNSTKAEVFIRFIEQSGDDNKIEFFGDEGLLSKLMAFNIEDIVDKLMLDQICLKNGKELYLIKNLDSLCIIIRLTSPAPKDREVVYGVLYNVLKEVAQN